MTPLSVSARLRQLLLILALAVVLWLPRGLGLDQYATADENAWLTRSANFYRALTQGDWAATFQRHHPGVTLTWAGTLGFMITYPGYAHQADREFGWLAEELTPFLRAHGHEPTDLLAAGRQVAVLSIVLVLLLAFVFAQRLWGTASALVGTLLVALDPFHIAHSRLMHLDGLLSSYMLLAVLALFVALQQAEARRWHWTALATSAVATGLACLTRSPGFFLLPFAALTGLVLWVRCIWSAFTTRRESSGNSDGTSRERGDWRKATWFLITTLALWALLAAITFYVLWPAMWVAPLATLREVFNAANEYAEAGHDDPIFFNGVIYNGDPGIGFYPITLLWRTTPVVWVGLIGALIGLALRPLRLRNPATKQRALNRTPLGQTIPPQSALGMQASILLLMLFVLGFWLLMNFGAKKFDRYLLPVYPMLDLGAGLAYVAGAGWLWQRRSLQARGRGQLAFLALIIGLQASLALPHYPYYLTYYNPLLGDGQAVINVMQIGRGEGANLAAQYLNAQATIDNRSAPIAASAFPNGPFSYFFRGQTVPPTYWSMADYAVLYEQDVQRQMPSARHVDWLTALPALATINLHGIPYARLYALADAPVPPYVMTWAEQDVAQIRLNSYELTAGAVQPGTNVHTTLYFENLASIASDLNVLVRLVGADGTEIARDEGWPWGAATSAWEAGAIWPDGHTLVIPPATPPGYYRLEVGFYDPSTQAPLQAKQLLSGNDQPDFVPLDYLQVGNLPQQPAVLLAQPYQIATLATLLGYTTETSTGRQIDIQSVPILPGEDLKLTLFWQVNESTNIAYTTFIHVIDSNGNMLTQYDGQPVRGLLPTSLWHQGQRIVDTYTLTIPAGSALGEYPLHVGLYDLATATRLPIYQEGAMVGDSIPLTRLVVALSRMEELHSGEGN